MPVSMSRRSALFASILLPVTVSGEMLHPLSRFHQDDSTTALPADKVFGFVRSAHINLAKTRELLKAEPRLIRAAWEWGPGDFEMAIDGAAHSGSRDIVEFLLEHGAPYSAFAAASLGDLATIQAMIKSQASVATSLGAHGIPLIEHAIAGGEIAEPVVEFLKQKDARPREKPKDLPTSNEYRAGLIGQYRIKADGQQLDFRIYSDDDKLFIDAGRMGTKRLQFQGQDIFQLEGTPAQLIFEMDGDKSIGALLREGAPIGRAIRINKQ